MASFDRSFSKSSLLLSQEDGSLLDAIRFLFFRRVGKAEFIACPAQEQLQESFKYRWIIFLSISVQKLLQAVAKPMAWFGSLLEMWLNLLSSNTNFFLMLWNLLRGKLVIPDRKSATFLSIIGHVDSRVELDKDIKHGDSRYNAALSMMASKASYENKAYLQTVVTDQWKMEFMDSFDFYNEYQKKSTTQAFVFRDKNVEPELIAVAFRGTEPFDPDAWCTDFDISWYELPEMGKVHRGFMRALGLQNSTGWPKDIQLADNQPMVAYYALRELLRKHLHDKAKFIVTGHSLGGALAVLFLAILAFHGEEWLLERLEGVYTFGQPRVGDEKFGDFMKQQLSKYSIRYHRFVYSNDMVPRLPYDDSTFMFKHFGTCIYFNCFYKAQVVSEEPNKNYFSPLSAIPKIVTAIWELIRSFTISYTKGADYREGWMLRFVRLMGLVVPGVSAHSLQDYVNATRLGSPDVYLQPHDDHKDQQSIQC
ncbi:triacylglycerol lipase OBL1-like isoform X2 [Diospyros lotus]|uniref:triacylglycerol lipase OBL1-like isoform X2 n=1 Tax=Diospyros lotus TaxID=55363 RepID=UPI00225552F6|nr:triacylglycerol lipase OBL1-like isoform X2 [Diospyros lotus]